MVSFIQPDLTPKEDALNMPSELPSPTSITEPPQPISSEPDFTNMSDEELQQFINAQTSLEVTKPAAPKTTNEPSLEELSDEELQKYIDSLKASTPIESPKIDSYRQPVVQVELDEATKQQALAMSNSLAGRFIHGVEQVGEAGAFVGKVAADLTIPPIISGFRSIEDVITGKPIEDSWLKANPKGRIVDTPITGFENDTPEQFINTYQKQNPDAPFRLITEQVTPEGSTSPTTVIVKVFPDGKKEMLNKGAEWSDVATYKTGASALAETAIAVSPFKGILGGGLLAKSIKGGLVEVGLEQTEDAIMNVLGYGDVGNRTSGEGFITGATGTMVSMAGGKAVGNVVGREKTITASVLEDKQKVLQDELKSWFNVSGHTNMGATMQRNASLVDYVTNSLTENETLNKSNIFDKTNKVMADWLRSEGNADLAIYKDAANAITEDTIQGIRKELTKGNIIKPNESNNAIADFSKKVEQVKSIADSNYDEARYIAINSGLTFDLTPLQVQAKGAAKQLEEASMAYSAENNPTGYMNKLKDVLSRDPKYKPTLEYIEKINSKDIDAAEINNYISSALPEVSQVIKNEWKSSAISFVGEGKLQSLLSEIGKLDSNITNPEALFKLSATLKDISNIENVDKNFVESIAVNLDKSLKLNVMHQPVQKNTAAQKFVDSVMTGDSILTQYYTIKSSVDVMSGLASNSLPVNTLEKVFDPRNDTILRALTGNLVEINTNKGLMNLDKVVSNTLKDQNAADTLVNAYKNYLASDISSTGAYNNRLANARALIERPDSIAGTLLAGGEANKPALIELLKKAENISSSPSVRMINSVDGTLDTAVTAMLSGGTNGVKQLIERAKALDAQGNTRYTESLQALLSQEVFKQVQKEASVSPSKMTRFLMGKDSEISLDKASEAITRYKDSGIFEYLSTTPKEMLDKYRDISIILKEAQDSGMSLQGANLVANILNPANAAKVIAINTFGPGAFTNPSSPLYKIIDASSKVGFSSTVAKKLAKDAAGTTLLESLNKRPITALGTALTSVVTQNSIHDLMDVQEQRVQAYSDVSKVLGNK